MQSNLLSFITNLLEKGAISVTKDLSPFTDIDQLEATNALHQLYERDALEMPYSAPEFSETAALWAVEYLYRAIQCSLLREIEEEQVKQLLPNYTHEINAAAIYSADLILRYLPDLWNLAKGLSPDDILVVLMNETAKKWPFSSIDIEDLEELEIDEILNHPSLRQAYIDRILQAEDKKRLKDERVMLLAKEVIGDQVGILKPKLIDTLKIQNQ